MSVNFFFKQKKKLAQINAEKLNDTYPDFAKYLYTQTTNLNSTLPNFLYFNNKTSSFEGVSMLTTYSILKLTSTHALKLLTFSPKLAPVAASEKRADNLYSYTNSTRLGLASSKASLLPFFHQFIYTFKLANASHSVDKLNEQSLEASRRRVNLLRSLARQLDMNTNGLRFNWIEELRDSDDDYDATESIVNESEYYEKEVETEEEEDDQSNEPEFIIDSIATSTLPPSISLR